MHPSDLPSRALPAAHPGAHPGAHPAAHPVPDAHGSNLFTADPVLARLLPLYLPADLLAHLLPHLQRLGALAGGVLDTLAHSADRHPPTLAHRSRSGVDAQRITKHPDYVALERVAFSDYGLAAMSHRGGVLGWPQPMPGDGLADVPVDAVQLLG